MLHDKFKPSSLSLPTTDGVVTPLVVNYVLTNFADAISLDDLAAVAGVSRYNLCRRFQQECGLSPMRWLWNFRICLAAELVVLDAEQSLTDIAFFCGFNSSAHFSAAFKGAFGVTPSAYRREQEPKSVPAPVIDLFRASRRLGAGL